LGFVRGWRLALVMLAVTPLLATAGAFVMKVMGNLSTRGQASYAKAGAFANEVLAAVRTVASFAAETKVADTYRASLVEARKIGVRTGFVSGFGIGLTMFIMFGVYALALWYGTQLIINGVRGCFNRKINFLDNDWRRCYDCILFCVDGSFCPWTSNA
jgi:ABC-type bacteriocin/lantibiotic exporter with double-glycine peptidase domain